MLEGYRKEGLGQKYGPLFEMIELLDRVYEAFTPIADPSLITIETLTTVVNRLLQL